MEVAQSEPRLWSSFSPTPQPFGSVRLRITRLKRSMLATRELNRGSRISRGPLSARLSDSEGRWTANVRNRDDERTRLMLATIAAMFLEALAVTVFLASFR